MKPIRFRLLIAALAVLLGTVVAQSQTADTAAPPPPPMHGHGQWGMDGHMMGFFADYLNLTDAQQAQMKTVMQKERPAMKPLFQQSHQIDQQLRQYVEGTFDEAKVQALATQKAQIEAQLTVAQARLHNELFQVLTPDQQGKMKDMEARHQARMAKHMQQSPPPSTDQQ
jgi:Spy/CpxP family protein refolding chaperone